MRFILFSPKCRSIIVVYLLLDVFHVLTSHASACRTVVLYGTQLQKHVEGAYSNSNDQNTCSYRLAYKQQDPNVNNPDHPIDYMYFHSNYWYVGFPMCALGGEVRIYAPNALTPDLAEGLWEEFSPNNHSWFFSIGLTVNCHEIPDSGTNANRIIYISIGVVLLILLIAIGLAFILKWRLKKNTGSVRNSRRQNEQIAPPRERQRHQNQQRPRRERHSRELQGHSNPLTTTMRALPQSPPPYTATPRTSESNIYLDIDSLPYGQPPTYEQALADGAGTPIDSVT